MVNKLENFMDRKILSKKERPDIINVKIDDFNSEISVLKICSKG